MPNIWGHVSFLSVCRHKINFTCQYNKNCTIFSLFQGLKFGKKWNPIFFQGFAGCVGTLVQA